MFRTLSPVGHPLSLGDVTALFHSDPNEASFLSRYFSAGSVFPVSSGTAALFVSLQTLKRTSARKEVVLPAYSCPALVAAVVKAGLQPVLCDMHLLSFSLDQEQLAAAVGEKTLAVVAVHLFGVPEDIPSIRALAAPRECFVLEDAAQAFGNYSPKSGGCFGSLGDMGIVSFGRGKPLSLLHGGAAIVNLPMLKEHMEAIHATLPGPPRLQFLMRHALLLLLYVVFFPPRTHWIPRSIPWLKLGETHYMGEFFATRIGPGVLRLGEALYQKFQDIRQVRKDLTFRYVEILKPYEGWFAYLPPIPAPEDDIALLRFPIVFNEGAVRDRVLSALLKKGLGGSGSYPLPLNELEGARARILPSQAGFPNAKAISQRILTLPLHLYVTERDLENIAQVFSDAL